MRFPALALAVRSLRVDGRSAAHAWTRVAIVLLLLAALAWSQRYAGMFGAPGLRFFWWLVCFDFWFVTLFGIASFSGVITEEKEAMTLSLLDLAGFGAASILLGKSVGQLVGAFLLLLVQLPFAMLSVTMGGVSTHQVAAAFVMLGCYAFAVFGTALLASTVCKRSRSAATLTAAQLGAWMIASRLVLLWASSLRQSGSRPGWLERTLADVVAVEPFGALFDVAATGYAEPLLHPPARAALTVGAVAVACAWLLFRRLHREEWRAGQSLGMRRPRGRRWAVPRPAPGPAALAWKDFRFLVGGPRMLVLRVLAYLALLLVYLHYAGRAGAGAFGLRSHHAQQLAPILYLVLLLECGVVASRFLLEEVKWQTLPGLAGLPFPIRSWLWAKVRGCAIRLLPITILLAGDLLVVLSDSSAENGRTVFAVGAYLFSLLWLVAHVAAYASLRLRRGGLAVAVATLLLCWTGTGLLLSVVVRATRSSEFEGGLVVIGLAFLVVSMFLLRAIHAKLQELGGK